MKKYFKPNSLTWLASVVPLSIGCFMAAEPLHGLTDWVQFFANGTEMTAPALINAGLIGVGLRGAID